MTPLPIKIALTFWMAITAFMSVMSAVISPGERAHAFIGGFVLGNIIGLFATIFTAFAMAIVS